MSDSQRSLSERYGPAIGTVSGTAIDTRCHKSDLYYGCRLAPGHDGPCDPGFKIGPGQDAKENTEMDESNTTDGRNLTGRIPMEYHEYRDIFNSNTSIGGSLSLETILVGDINRLRHINRFATALVAHRENVAEHSFYVSWYSLLIALDAKARGHELDLAQVLVKAITHDAEEARTGDIYRPFKVSNPELKDLLHKCAKSEMLHLLRETTNNTAIIQLLYRQWDSARDESVEGCIVALADYLGVLAHMLQELKTANFTMKVHYESMIAYSEEFNGPEFDFLRDLVLEARLMVRELLGEKVAELEQALDAPEWCIDVSRDQ
jgi:5'-deoxynucleotidase YfbR-like HD superfamily hydrolase